MHFSFKSHIKTIYASPYIKKIYISLTVLTCSTQEWLSIALYWGWITIHKCTPLSHNMKGLMVNNWWNGGRGFLISPSPGSSTHLLPLLPSFWNQRGLFSRLVRVCGVELHRSMGPLIQDKHGAKCQSGFSVWAEQRRRLLHRQTNIPYKNLLMSDHREQDLQN